MKNKIYVFFVSITSFVVGLYSLNNMNITTKNDLINNFVTSNTPNVKNYLKEYVNSISPQDFNMYIYKKLKKEKINIVDNQLENTINKLVGESKKKKEEPIIYIYNTHQKEKYANGTLGVYELNPTVLSASYLIKDMFEDKNINVIVEETDIIKTMNKRKYTYYQTYNITRELVQKTIKNYPSIKYFIDLHRDSISKKASTVIIKEKPYAKIMFVVGMKNKNSSKNLKFMETLNDKFKKKYPGISRGIYKKNYIYNQDLNPGVILIELGGNENTMEEVYNSCNAIVDVLIEYIGENNE